jgi:transposase
MKRPESVEITSQEKEELLERLSKNSLNDSDVTILSKVLKAYCWLQHAFRETKISLHRIKSFFGFRTTEKKAKLPKENSDDTSEDRPSRKRQTGGHGRLGHDAYWGAENIYQSHETLKAGDCCPEGCGGHLRSFKDRIVVALKGQSFVSAFKHFLESFRCSGCQKVFTAKPPKKYAASVKAIIAMAKTYMGIPFNRIAMAQLMTGVPLPNATQCALLNSLKEDILPIYEALESLAAQGELFHHDDTTVKILEVMEENKTKAKKERRGMYTSGIYSKFKGHTIALFKSGTHHCGENMTNLLKKREKGSGKFIRMADALTSNLKVTFSSSFKEVLSHCLAHARRKFYEIYEYFPGFCRRVIDDLAKVYENDADTKEQLMNEKERQQYHKKHSAPIMKDLKEWMEKQLEEKNVEENSSLGKAFYYMLKRWDKFTAFLRTPGCPLDNNIVEGALKIPIRARKNSLFYKTRNGAEVGSVLTSVIHTCVLAKENPIDYLIALQENERAVRKSPHDWLPWTYKKTLASLSQSLVA